MGLRGCLKNFLAKAGQKKDLGIYCEQLTKLETLHGFLLVAEPLRLLLMKMLRKLKSLFLAKKKIQELMKVKRNIGRIIGISQSSVMRICRQSLGLTAFHQTKVQDLSDADKLKRVTRGKRLLRFLTVADFYWGEAFQTQPAEKHTKWQGVCYKEREDFYWTNGCGKENILEKCYDFSWCF